MNQSNLYRVSALPGILQTSAAAQQQQQPLLLLLVRHQPVRTPTVHYRSTTTPAFLATLLASRSLYQVPEKSNSYVVTAVAVET